MLRQAREKDGVLGQGVLREAIMPCAGWIESVHTWPEDIFWTIFVWGRIFHEKSPTQIFFI